MVVQHQHNHPPAPESLRKHECAREESTSVLTLYEDTLQVSYST